MTNTNTWEEELEAFLVKNEAGEWCTNDIEAFVRKAYERGLKEGNVGRIMYERGRREAVEGCINALEEEMYLSDDGLTFLLNPDWREALSKVNLDDLTPKE